MQTEVEYEAEGVFFVSGNFRLVVDIAAHITDHVQPLRLRLPVRSSLVTLTDLTPEMRWDLFYLFAVVTAVDMEDIFLPSKCIQMVFGSMKSRP